MPDNRTIRDMVRTLRDVRTRRPDLCIAAGQFEIRRMGPLSVNVNATGAGQGSCSAAMLKVPLLAGRSINCERCGYGVGCVIPRSVESHAGVTSSGRNAAVVTKIGQCDIRAALHQVAVPNLGNRLTIGKGPSQRPIADGGGSRVVDRDSGSKASGPLARNGVANMARETGGARRTDCKSDES